MGIRFFCPNGHRLHVKAFLAGKRGYCPKCGTKLLIPESSAAALPRTDSASKDQAADLLPGARESTSGAAAGPATTGPQAESPSQPDAQPVEHERMQSRQPILESPIQTDGPLDDALWYVRPPSGGQYGPATRKEIDRWSGEGRIPGESLVWREGWAEWRTAADALYIKASEMHSSTEGSYAELSPQSTDSRQALNLRAHQVAARRKKIAFVICLGLACLILTVILLVVVRPWSG